MIGSLRARAAPIIINYRYGHDELAYLPHHAGTRALVYRAAFAPAVARVVPTVGRPIELVQVAGGSENGLLPEAVRYGDVLASALDIPLPDLCSDDLFLIYPSGTTGMPNEVMRRQCDLFVSVLGGRSFRDGGRAWASVDERVSSAGHGGYRAVPVAPFMHAAWAWTGGLEVDMDRVNPSGGATVLGPLLGVTSVVGPTKAVYALQRANLQTALIITYSDGELGTGTIVNRA
jgi:acyl-CoA synthetase (AMP-forming)/AMP-acid ligase II